MNSAFFDTTDTGGPNWVQHVFWLLGQVEVWMLGLILVVGLAGWLRKGVHERWSRVGWIIATGGLVLTGLYLGGVFFLFQRGIPSGLSAVIGVINLAILGVILWPMAQWGMHSRGFRSFGRASPAVRAWLAALGVAVCVMLVWGGTAAVNAVSSPGSLHDTYYVSSLWTNLVPMVLGFGVWASVYGYLSLGRKVSIKSVIVWLHLVLHSVGTGLVNGPAAWLSIAGPPRQYVDGAMMAERYAMIAHLYQWGLVLIGLGFVVFVVGLVTALRQSDRG
ncbi:hypothetical protein RMQ97_12200 [Maricaulis sp. D1M11]|uniref:hypothetical protein n=1 Tax=Maricaulis sp. D1M11 TaxID=3076117 RepID=UPI0039B36C1C